MVIHISDITTALGGQTTVHCAMTDMVDLDADEIVADEEL
jgi:hypothetical protein